MKRWDENATSKPEFNKHSDGVEEVKNKPPSQKSHDRRTEFDELTPAPDGVSSSIANAAIRGKHQRRLEALWNDYTVPHLPPEKIEKPMGQEFHESADYTSNRTLGQHFTDAQAESQKSPANENTNYNYNDAVKLIEQNLARRGKSKGIER